MNRRFVLSLLAGATATTAATPLLASDVYSGTPQSLQGWPYRHFTPWEFASKGNGMVVVKVRMVEALDRVRHRFGRPMIITSGYRDPAHNARVGGAPRSRHMVGDAVDLNLAGFSNAERQRLMSLLLEEGFTSFGSYGRSPTMLHADMRPHAAIWRHGGGDYPAWFRNALRDAGWQSGVGATK